MAAEASLEGAVDSLAKIALNNPSSTISRLDDSIEEHLGKVDEVSILIDSLRAEVGNTVDIAYPELMKASAEVQALFAVIDAAEAAVNKVQQAGKAVSERMEVLQKGYDTKHPEGFSKLASWFGALQKQPIDAPVTLPIWDKTHANIVAETEIAHIQGHVGVLTMVPQASGSGDGPAETPGGDDRVQANIQEFMADAGRGEEGAAEGPATITSTITSPQSAVRTSAIAAGEEDEDEDEDDE